MLFRILLRAFDNQSMKIACQLLRQSLFQTDCKVTGTVALPTRIKRFCVLRSPHIDKDSRERSSGEEISENDAGMNRAYASEEMDEEHFDGDFIPDKEELTGNTSGWHKLF
jgi:N-acetylglutamate synthase-like GNAT family acetyltransferase